MLGWTSACAVRLFLMVSLAFAFALPTVAGPSAAYAQERQRPNLLDVLRGRPRKVTPPEDTRRVRRVERDQRPRRATAGQAPRKAAPRRTTRKAAPRRTNREPARRVAKKPAIRKAEPAPVATAPAVEKVESAAKVLVIGDFLAGGLADGLEETFAESPGVVVIAATNGSSGLVRDDYHDWTAELPALLEAHDPRVVAVQLGANDGQPLSTSAGTLREGTEEWSVEYARRAGALAKLIRESGAQLVWVGAPSFQSRSLTADVVRFNEHFEAAATAVGGAFVDVWEGFVDQNGAYIRSGPDVNGQVVRLRGSDGINLTAAGKQKMAFFAEKEIRRLLGGMDTPGYGTVNAIELPPIGEDLLQAPLQPRMSPPIALAQDSSSDVELAGATSTDAPRVTAAPVANGLLAPENGRVPAERADNFSWPPNG